MMADVIKRTHEFWHRFHMDIAVRTSLLSKDPDRKVGAIITTPSRRQLSYGYNGFPAGVADTRVALYDKELKLERMVHAEENCIKQAPFSTWNCTMYVTRFPCDRCARLIVGAGIVQVVAPRPDFDHPRWGASWALALTELQSSGVLVNFMEVNA
jgi:dCMP deaminase